MRAAIAILALLSAVSVIVPTTNAQPASLVYTSVVTDVREDAIAFGFLDLLNVAIAEPQDGNILMRLQTRDLTSVAPAGQSQLVVSLKIGTGNAVSGVIASTGAAAAVGNTLFRTCAIEAGYVVCKIPCAKVGTTVVEAGVQLSDIYAYSRVTQSATAQVDYAPGGLYAPESQNNFPKGTSYTIGACFAPEPTDVYDELEGAPASTSVVLANPTNRTLHYNWTNPEMHAGLELQADVGSGGADVTVFDSAGTQLAAFVLAAGNTSHPLGPGEPGTWRIDLGFREFSGSLNLTLEPLATPAPSSQAPSPSPTPDATDASESPKASETGTEEGAAPNEAVDTPGPLVLATCGMVLVALMVQRRRHRV